MKTSQHRENTGTKLEAIGAYEGPHKSQAEIKEVKRPSRRYRNLKSLNYKKCSFTSLESPLSV
jgi:hypothetical protein